MRCKRRTNRTTSSVTMSVNVSRQNVESSRLNLWRSFNPQSFSFFVCCDLLCQLQFQSHHLPRSATQAVPVRRFPSIAECLSCPTFASHNSILGHAQNCSSSIMKTDKNSLSHAACKWTDTVFSIFTEPNLLSKLRLGSPSSTSSPRITRFSHFVHDFRCKNGEANWVTDCHLRYAHLCCVQRKSWEFFTVFVTSLKDISTRPLAMWSPSGGPCGITSTPAHAWSTASWSAFMPDSLSHFKMRKIWWNLQEMKWSMQWKRFRSQLDKSELETCLRFPVSRCRIRKLQPELSFVFPNPPTVQFDVVHQHLDLDTSRTPIPVNSISWIFMFLFLCSWDSSDSFLLWEFLLPKVLHLHHFPFRHLHKILQLVRRHHQVVQHLDSEFSRISLLGSGRNWKCCFRDNWNEFVLSMLWIGIM